MKKTFLTSTIGVAALGLFTWLPTVTAPAQTGTFTDPLTSSNANWSYVNSGGGYAITYPGAGVNLYGTLLTGKLNLPTSGGNVPASIAGDFSTSINFADFVETYFTNATTHYNLGFVRFQASFADGGSLIDTYGNDVSPGQADFAVQMTGNGQNYSGGYTNTATGGTFAISRSGSTITSSFDGTTWLSGSADSSALTGISFEVGSGTLQVSATFSDFSLTGNGVTATPEPSTLALAGLGGAAFLARLRRRK